MSIGNYLYTVGLIGLGILASCGSGGSHQGNASSGDAGKSADSGQLAGGSQTSQAPDSQTYCTPVSKGLIMGTQDTALSSVSGRKASHEDMVWIPGGDF